MNFVESYVSRAREMRSILCVGLDPTYDQVPPSMRQRNDWRADIYYYIHSVIDIAASKVAIVKPQYAFYGAMGSDGFRILHDIVAYAVDCYLLTILDAKRADIGNTMEAYGREVFDEIRVHAVTAVPYLGSATIQPLMPWLKRNRCVISMVRT